MLSVVSGYLSARIYKTMRGQQWKKTAFMVSDDIKQTTYYNTIIKRK